MTDFSKLDVADDKKERELIMNPDLDGPFDNLTASTDQRPAPIRELGPSRFTLYERIEALNTVEAWIEEYLNETPLAMGAVPDFLVVLLEMAELDVQTKVANVACMWRDLEVETAGIQTQIDRMIARRDSRKRVVAHLKSFAEQALKASPVKKITDPRVTVWLQKKPDSIRYTGDPAAIPEAFRKPPADPEPALTAVRDYYKAHKTMPDGFVLVPGELGIRSS